MSSLNAPEQSPPITSVARDRFFDRAKCRALAIFVGIAGLFWYVGHDADATVTWRYIDGSFVLLVGAWVLDYRKAPYRRAATALAAQEAARWRELRLAQEARLFALTPREFELAVARAFAARFGYETRVTPAQNDGGWDVELLQGGSRILVECKQFAPTQAVGRPILQKLHSAMVTERAAGAVLVTTGTITAPARTFAQGQGILLFDAAATRMLFKEAATSREHPDLIWVLCARCAARQLLDLRESRDIFFCPAGHPIPHPVPELVIARRQAAHRWAVRERAKNVEMATFRARIPERMREEVDRAEQDLEHARDALAFDRAWVNARMGEHYATREEAERIAAVANWLVPRFATREAELPVLQARIHERQVAYEQRVATDEALAVRPCAGRRA